MKTKQVKNFISKLEPLILEKDSNEILQFLNDSYAIFFDVDEKVSILLDNSKIAKKNRSNITGNFSYFCNKERTKLINPTITIDPQAAQIPTRLIKLFSHEWMHFYTALAEFKMVEKEKIYKKYKDKILLSPNWHYDDLKQKYADKTILEAVVKLSPYESVADEFAMDILQLIVNYCNDVRIKEGATKQIKAHNEQIERCQTILKNANLETIFNKKAT